MEDTNYYVPPQSSQYSKQAEEVAKGAAEWIDYLKDRMFYKCVLGREIRFEEWKLKNNANIA